MSPGNKSKSARWPPTFHGVKWRPVDRPPPLWMRECADRVKSKSLRPILTFEGARVLSLLLPLPPHFLFWFSRVFAPLFLHPFIQWFFLV